MKEGEAMARDRRVLGISLNIILLGIVSFLTDTSSEMMFPVLPFFIMILGGTGVALGLIGGLGDSVSSILRVFSGYWSDKYGRRKVFVVSGYGASAASKMFFPLSTHWWHLAVLRPIERVGKGIRTAPRDALIADFSEESVRGKVFGLHRALDTSGAILGSLLAFFLFWSLSPEGAEPEQLKEAIITILWIGVAVAFLALVPLIFVTEKRREPKEISLALSIAGLPRDLKLLIAAASVFAMANFTYMLFLAMAKDMLMLLGYDERLATALAILMYVVFNSIYALLAIPMGMLADRVGMKRVILGGYVVFAAVCLGFVFSWFYALSLATIVVLFATYGLTYAMTNGTQRAFTSKLASEDIRGTALGTFHTAVGLATLPGGILAGFLFDIQPYLAFLYGAALAIVAMALLAMVSERG